MNDTLPTFRVRWSMEKAADADVVRLTCDDAVGQQSLSFDLPIRTIPGLVSVLQKLIDDHPEMFPVALLERVTWSGIGHS